MTKTLSINAIKPAGTKGATKPGYDIKTLARAAQRLLAQRITAADEIVIRRDEKLHIILRGEDITARVWLAMEGPRGGADAAEDSKQGLKQIMLAPVIEWLALNTDIIRFALQ